MPVEDFDTGDTYLTRVLSTDRITAEAASEDVRKIEQEVERGAFVYESGSNNAQLALCVRRCHCIDEYSGETYPGIAPFRALVKHTYRDVPDWRGQEIKNPRY